MRNRLKSVMVRGIMATAIFCASIFAAAAHSVAEEEWVFVVENDLEEGWEEISTKEVPLEVMQCIENLRRMHEPTDFIKGSRTAAEAYRAKGFPEVAALYDDLVASHETEKAMIEANNPDYAAIRAVCNKRQDIFRKLASMKAY